MSNRYKKVQWVVQHNLTSPLDLDRLRNSCGKLGVNLIELDIIPFSSELPKFDRSRHSIIYGSTTFNNLAFRDAALRKGVFYSESDFSIENYIRKWGRYMLNYEALLVTFHQLINDCKYSGDKLLFIRPDNDNKSFAGEVKRFEEVQNWFEQLKTIENADLTPQTKIVVSEPYNIHYEWRL